jgi:hypothetical protein
MVQYRRFSIQGLERDGDSNTWLMAITRLNGKQLKPETITSDEIKDDSILAVDINFGAGATLQGNLFNTASKLVKLDSLGRLPAVSGALLTNLPGGGGGGGPTATTDLTDVGGAVNTALGLIKLDGTGKIPVLNGSAITSLNGSSISSGTVADARLSTNVTLSGNAFNGVSQLVQLDGAGKLPSIDGSQLTGIDVGDFSNGGEAGGANRTLGNTDAFDLGFETTDITRMTIKADGKIGIGIEAPTVPLDVFGSVSVVGQVTATGYGRVQNVGISVTGPNDDKFRRYYITALTEAGETDVSVTADLHGPAALDESNFYTLTWDALPGALSYNVYRWNDGGGLPASTGLIGNTTSLTFDDTGFAGTTTWPNGDITGAVSFGDEAEIIRAGATPSVRIKNPFGDTKPSALSVENGNGAAGVGFFSGTGTGDPPKIMFTGSGGPRLDIGATSAGFDSGFFPKLTVLNNGKVGIGTTSPSEILDVIGKIRNTGEIQMGDGTTTTHIRMGTNDSARVGILRAGSNSILLYEGTNESARVRVQSDRVTIGGRPGFGVQFGESNVACTVQGHDTSTKTAFKVVDGSAAIGSGAVDLFSVDCQGLMTAKTVKITGGTPGVGKVLTSDADGDATWETSGAGGNHALTHENSGIDEISVAGLSGVLADAQVADKIKTSGTAVSISGTAPSTGQVLTATTSSAAEWQTPSGGGGVAANPWRLTLSVSQSIAHNISSKLDMDTAEYDVGSFHDVPNRRITPTVSGKYYVQATCLWQSAGTSFVALQLKKNGSVTLVVEQRSVNGDTGSFTMDLSTMVEMNGTTDYIEVFAEQKSGVSRTISGGSNNTVFSGFKVAD